MADRLRVTELDFDTIKDNLKTFLNQQSEFTDYDFEGSGLSILLDILAYNTHYNAYYLNMVANESFLDTALLRESVLSHAKTLGYVPYSRKSPVARINFTALSNNNNPSTLTIPAGYSFLSNQIDNTVYNFVVLNDVIATKANSSFFFENLDIHEGRLITYKFIHNQATNPKQVFLLPDENIDTTTIKVTVSPSTSNTDVLLYSKVTDVLDVQSDTQVFFLQETRSGRYEIYFGDDILGKKIPDGGIVNVSYLVTSGTVANKANNFVATAPLTDLLSESLTNFIIDPVDAASGGSEKESIDEIKYNSVAQFTTQNRLVTFNDYESYILKNYPSIDSISVWGGEDEIPPVFGKVYVSLKPKNNFFISETEKQRIIDEIINPKAIVSVGAEIRDPDFLYLIVENTVQYDKRKTILTEENLKGLLRNSVISYKNVNLDTFESTFVLSKMQDGLDAVDPNSIIGSESVLKIQKRFVPEINVAKTYDINFNTELTRGSVATRLISNRFQTFDSVGNLRSVLLEEVPDSSTGITQIQVLNPGSGYTTTPSVTITGDGFGATAEARIVNGRVESIVLTNRGINYSRAIITISGGNGFGAQAVAVLDSKFGVIRTIYFDELSRRQIVNPNAGTINYETGKVTLNDIRIVSVEDSDGLIRLTVNSANSILKSTRNVIITIDESDPISIVNNLVQV
jgi:hypothetical protein